MGKMFEEILTATSKQMATLDLVREPGHTGRRTPAGPHDSLVEDWSNTSPDRLLSHAGAERFRMELLNVVPRVAGDLICERGRADGDPTIKGWMQMGPPEKQPPGRYNVLGDSVLYLSDSIAGVFAEKEGARIFCQKYLVPISKLRAGDFSSPDLSDFVKAVFEKAENEGRNNDPSTYPFSQAVARLVRDARFECMIVPGVQGNPSLHYSNVAVFNGRDKWETWSLRDAGFSIWLNGKDVTRRPRGTRARIGLVLLALAAVAIWIWR